MIRIERRVTVDRPVDEVAHYLTDFRTTAQWDPHTARCDRIDTGQIGVGSRFVNKQKIGPLRRSFDYTLTEYDAGRSVRLESHGRGADMVDTMRFAGDRKRTTVTYTAEFTFKGLTRYAEPMLKPPLNKIGDDGAKGMTAALQRLPLPKPGETPLAMQ